MLDTLVEGGVRQLGLLPRNARTSASRFSSGWPAIRRFSWMHQRS
jgi:hypothetical protein